jgi:hypothetical protein
MAAFNASAVGVGAARKKYEGLLQKFLKKAFEVFNIMSVIKMKLHVIKVISIL